MSTDDTTLAVTPYLRIPLAEIEFQGIRAQGAGGQNVNKVSSAIHLRFDIAASSLPETYKERLQALRDKRISSDGIVVIKAQRFRSQEKNRADALDRLAELVRATTVKPKARRPTKPTKSSKRKRMDSKTKRGRLKSLRGKIDDG